MQEEGQPLDALPYASERAVGRLLPLTECPRVFRVGGAEARIDEASPAPVTHDQRVVVVLVLLV